VALRFLGAGTSRQTEPIDLLIAWVHDKNKSMFGFAHEFDRDKLRCRAAEYRWTLHDLKLIAAEWFQGIKCDVVKKKKKNGILSFA
jgi:hypothetical protein